MKKAPKVLVVGSLVMDMIITAPKFPSEGESVFGDSFSTAPGGKGANQAVQAARLGADVTMVGMVGADANGKALIDSLKESGVNVDNMMINNSVATSVANVQIQKTPDKTENRIIIIAGSNNSIKVKDVEFLKDSISEYDIVLLQNEIPEEINVEVARYANAAGVPVMLNPAPYRELPEELVALTSYVSPNEHEAKDMTGVEIKSKDDVKRALEILKSKGVKNPLITLGSDGCALLEDGEVFFCPCAKTGTVIDPTAAGDSFIGAFCTATAAGISGMDRLHFANHTAAITVCGMGAQPSLPKLDSVVSLLCRNGFDTEPYSILSRTKDQDAEHIPDVLDSFVDICVKEFEASAYNVDHEALFAAASLILDAKAKSNRLHITGIGKPSHIAGYAASLISSTGTPAYYLHGTEAVHGSCGQLVEGDVVICISNSGETAELKATAIAIKNNGCKIIALTSNPNSWLGSFADVCLVAKVDHEGGVLNRAPRASILSETFVLQCLSVLLQEKSSLTPEKYVRFHPGGTLGKLRDNEK